MRLFSKSIKQQTDDDLLSLYRQKREQTVLAELFTRYTHLVYGVCMKYLKNPEDASDAVMNIYEKLSNDIHRHTIIKFSTWLYVMAKNHCLMELRSRKTLEKKHGLWEKNIELFMESELLLHPLDDETEINLQQLTLCLQQLRNDQRRCIELFYYQNRCYMEIADALKMDEKSVKSHLQNGKRNLKICLDKAHAKKEAS